MIFHAQWRIVEDVFMSESRVGQTRAIEGLEHQSGSVQSEFLSFLAVLGIESRASLGRAEQAFYC